MKRKSLPGKELEEKVVQRACFKVGNTRIGLNAHGRDLAE